ncbi:MAG: B12-binding domain-containing radical SAM protein, partial [bacterium]
MTDSENRHNVEIELDALPRVTKPARYTGGEWNQVKHDWDSAGVRFALCFPEIYEIGMSNLGFLLLYHLINEIPDTLCERCFAPWPDFERELSERGLPLCSLENRMPLADFDVVGFSLSYEMTYTNVLTMLKLGGIPFRAADRAADWPLVIAGGGSACNP